MSTEKIFEIHKRQKRKAHLLFDPTFQSIGGCCYRFVKSKNNYEQLKTDLKTFYFQFPRFLPLCPVSYQF